MEQKITTPGTGERDSLIVCRNSQGIEFRASLLRLSRFEVVFEVYNPYSILQVSEVLADFRIIISDRLVYSGRAVVSNLVNTGILLVCEATLGEDWLDVDFFSPVHQRNRLRSEFAEFLKEWEKINKIIPGFKVVIADMQTFLMDLRRWLEQVEVGIRSEPTGSRQEMERDVILALMEPVVPLMLNWFGRFDEVAEGVEVPMLPAHRAYSRRLLHPLVLCSPFVYRTFQKPLGYAGDYEMVNMILREPYEGASLFAKIVNVCFLHNPPAEAHRNRVEYLTVRLAEESTRVVSRGARPKIFNLGCGPAKEVQNFMEKYDVSDHAELTLLDFNDETLAHTTKQLEEVRNRHRRTTGIHFVKKSVHQILKQAARPVSADEAGFYDFVYCAGLFDYMSDRICKRLMNYFYDVLAPGGLLLVTNVDSAKPFRHSMEFILEWYLICRNPAQVEALRPDAAPAEACRAATDVTGVNVFVEIRKPDHV